MLRLKGFESRYYLKGVDWLRYAFWSILQMGWPDYGRVACVFRILSSQRVWWGLSYLHDLLRFGCFREQSDRSRCLPKFGILGVCKVVVFEWLWGIILIFCKQGDWIMDALHTPESVLCRLVAFYVFANRATGLWTRRVRTLGFVYKKCFC